MVDASLPLPQRLVCLAALTFPAGVSALAFAPFVLDGGRCLLAVGLDSGEVSLHVTSPVPPAPAESALTLSPLLVLPAQHAHADVVRRLSWAPGSLPGSALLASCAEDHSVRLFRFALH